MVISQCNTPRLVEKDPSHPSLEISETKENAEDVTQLPDRSHLSLRAVQPVDVEVNDLALHVDTTPSIFQSPAAAIWSRISPSKGQTAFKTILDGVTASMPHGTLTAIIGGSGSGKTSLLNIIAGRMGTSRMKVSGVRETLQYSADLRLPPPTTVEERHAVVERVILELGLKECADTRIGNPSVLFCDEPTTGLDATSAYQVVRSLKRLALDGRTIIISIHSPRSEIWGLFDKVVLLSRGSVLYSGDADKSVVYFEKQGYSIPPFVNPAEFLVDLAAYDNRTPEAELASRDRVESLRIAWSEASRKKPKKREPASSNRQPITGRSTHESVGFTRQFWVLTARTIKMTIRDPMGMTSCLFEAIGMAVLNGWVYLQLDGSLTGIRSRQGSLYTASSLNGSEGVVGVPAFLLSRRAARLFLEDLPVPILFSTIFYFMVGYRLAAVEFFVFLTVACGYFVQTNQIPVYVRWFYDCPYSKDPMDPHCKEYTGRFIVDSLGIPQNWIWRPIVVLASFAVFFYALAGVILKFNKIDIIVAQPRNAEKDHSVGKEKFIARPQADSRQVSIKLENYSLDIKKRFLTRRGFQMKNLSIIKPITAEFEPGKLNVIMGPSGSGKTSLLCSIANRLQGSIGTRYYVGGDMLYNGAKPSRDVVRSVTSFVTQDDDALMPSLTVRESLEFAAGLRLPTWMSKDEKNRRAEAILLKMGLKDCANNLIGSDLIKGISGGEKRRVSIAIQILTDPKILLLDEPTSGLDVFTATSIIEVLNGLAAEARGGYPVYAGSGPNMLPHFESLGYECPRTTNPTDFALDLITVDLQAKSRETATRAKVQRLIDSWEVSPHGRETEASTIAVPAELGSLKRKPTAFPTMFALVLRRSAINLRRQPYLLLARTMQVIGVAIIMALFFAPLKDDYAAVQSRMGAVQQITALYFVGMLQNIAIYPYERDVFYREESDDCYSTEAFILQYTTLEVPFEIISALLYGIISAYAIGVKRTVTMLFVSSFNAFCITSCGESLGIMFCTLFSHAVNHLSPVKYSISNLAPYSMHGRTFICADNQRLPNGHCPIETGEQVLSLYNLDKDPKINLVALGICVVSYRLVAYTLIKVVRSRTVWKNLRGKLSKGQRNTKDTAKDSNNSMMKPKAFAMNILPIISIFDIW
ncbi:TPA_exp: ABC drug exporter AtrF [Trichophyton benhamiae CBS 112371]|nr:TPA_exp: ABC drug exporter AtrF [Trichophyton benhamiae CBS 112371]